MEQRSKLGEYRLVEEIGRGSFGKVYRCEWRNKVVALKRMSCIDVQLGLMGVSQSGYREMTAFRILNGGHENVVRMFECFVENDFFISMEYGQEHLRQYLTRTRYFLSEGHRKDLMQQMLKGIRFIHSKTIIHRDLKPENVVMVKGMVLKIIDFGISKILTVPCFEFSQDIQTLPYRDIDVLLDGKSYTFSIDIWSIGCIMAEVYGVDHPLFSEHLCPTCVISPSYGQIISIMVNLGIPTEDRWPGISKRKRLQEVLKVFCTHIREKSVDDIRASLYLLFTGCGSGGKSTIAMAGVEIMAKMLRYDPTNRPSANEILKDVYFTG